MQSGDVTICFHCFDLLEATSDMQFIPLPEATLDKMTESDQDFLLNLRKNLIAAKAEA